MLRPKDTSKLEKRVAVVTEDEVELVATNFQLVRGKVPRAALSTVDEWLRKMSALDKSALDSLNAAADDDGSEHRQLWVFEQQPSQLEEIQWDRYGYGDMTDWKRRKVLRSDYGLRQAPYEFLVAQSLERKAKERVTARGFEQSPGETRMDKAIRAASRATQVAALLLLMKVQPMHVASVG